MAVMYTANHLNVSRDHRTDRIGFDGAMDVPHPVGYPDLRADAAISRRAAA